MWDTHTQYTQHTRFRRANWGSERWGAVPGLVNDNTRALSGLLPPNPLFIPLFGICSLCDGVTRQRVSCYYCSSSSIYHLGLCAEVSPLPFIHSFIHSFKHSVHHSFNIWVSMRAKRWGYSNGWNRNTLCPHEACSKVMKKDHRQVNSIKCNDGYDRRRGSCLKSRLSLFK